MSTDQETNVPAVLPEQQEPPPDARSCPTQTATDTVETAALPDTEIAVETAAVVAPEVNVGEQVEDDASNTTNMEAAMQTAMQRMQEMKAQLEESDKQRESDIKKRAERLQIEQENKSKYETELSQLRAVLKQRKDDELQTARKKRDDTFNRLTETLTTLECDLKKRKPTDTKGQLQFESDIAEAAIKRLVKASDQAAVMSTENNQLKRQHEDIASNLCNFEVGRVEASAEAAAKRRHVQQLDTDTFLTWKRQNPRALKWQVDAQLKKYEEAKRDTVRVNASFLKWNEAADAPQVTSQRPLTSSIYTSYPEIASQLMMMNTGKVISADETLQMMQTTPDQTQISRKQPWQ